MLSKAWCPTSKNPRCPESKPVGKPREKRSGATRLGQESEGAGSRADRPRTSIAHHPSRIPRPSWDQMSLQSPLRAQYPRPHRADLALGLRHTQRAPVRMTAHLAAQSGYPGTSTWNTSPPRVGVPSAPLRKPASVPWAPAHRKHCDHSEFAPSPAFPSGHGSERGWGWVSRRRVGARAAQGSKARRPLLAFPPPQGIQRMGRKGFRARSTGTQRREARTGIASAQAGPIPAIRRR